MEHKLVNFALIIFLFILACQNKEDESGQSGNMERATVDLKERQKENLVIDDFFSLKKIVPLETKDNSLIKNIAKIYLHNENLFLLDNLTNEIFHYDTVGTLIRKISHLGRGPGEYGKISDMIIDFDENVCYVLDGIWTKKVIKYTLEGSFVKEYPMDFASTAFYKINDNSFAFYAGNTSSGFLENDNTSFSNLIFTDSLFKVVSRSLPIDKKWDGYSFSSGSMNTYFYKNSKGLARFIPQLPLNMAIYNLGETATDITLHKHVAFSNNNSLETLLEALKPKDIPNTFAVLKKGSFAYNIHNYMENECFTFFSASSGKTFRVLFDNSNDQVYYENRDVLDQRHGPYFSPSPVWASSSNNIAVNILTPIDILQNDFELAIPLREHIDINDNPVLVFYEFKNCNP